MNMWTWRPSWDPLSELQRQVDRLFDISVDVGRQFWQTWRPFPPYNLYETDGEYVLVAPLPGVNPEQLDVSVNGGTLVLKGERLRAAGAADEAYRRQERWLGRWTRTVPLPERADTNQVSATLENGLLTIRMPKLIENPARQIPVTVANGR
jgi:HSP20 family protein